MYFHLVDMGLSTFNSLVSSLEPHIAVTTSSLRWF